MMKIPFLKPGKFPSSNGSVTFSEEDMNKIIEATKNREYQNDTFPIVIGHPKTDSPAWGWIKKDAITNSNDILIALAEEENLNEDFIKWHKKGLYKTVSAKLRKDYSIAHIGFLGAQPPAVTGLPAISLADEDEILCEVELAEFEINKWWFEGLSRIFRRWKNQLIADKGLESADKIVADYEIDSIATPPNIWEKNVGASKMFSENEDELKTKNQLEENEMKELDEAKVKLAEKDTALAEATLKLKQIEDQAKANALAAKKNEFVLFCESDEIKEKIKDIEKEGIVETLLSLSEVETFEFGEGDNKTKVKAVDLVKGLIARLPNVVELGEKFNNGNSSDGLEDTELSEYSGKAVDKDRLEMHKKALKISKAENISYEAAIKKVK